MSRWFHEANKSAEDIVREHIKEDTPFYSSADFLFEQINDESLLEDYLKLCIKHVAEVDYTLLSKIKNKDFYIIETNYNDKMLSEGPYPYLLQQRIRGDSGHMSNRYAGSLLAKCIGLKTKHIILAHISEHNNDKNLVLEEVKDELKNTDFDCNKLILTEQNTPSEMIEI